MIPRPIFSGTDKCVYCGEGPLNDWLLRIVTVGGVSAHPGCVTDSEAD